MNTDTGRIYTPEEMEIFNKAREGAALSIELFNFIQKNKPNPTKLAEEMLLANQENKIIEMKVPPTAKQLLNKKVQRNDPCPCGSRKKFKKCHWTGRKI